MTLHHGDCLEVMAGMEPESLDAVVTDPPYSIGFMGRKWDQHPDEDAAFGYWLAGFTDGEGHFRVQAQARGTYSCAFSLHIRRDDRAILERIRKFLGVGSVVDEKDNEARNPMSRLNVQAKADCLRVVEVFIRYPLRAKKLRDFLPWADAVLEWNGMERGHRWRGKADWTRLAQLKERVESARAYRDIPWSGHGFQDWSREWGEQALRVTKPGGYLLSMGGTRTYHRMVCGLEDAGWIIRDCLVYAYASGFPKSKASLKPAWEPIVMARKPGPLRMLAIDECRIGYASPEDYAATVSEQSGARSWKKVRTVTTSIDLEPAGEISANPAGRWPANVILGDEIFEPGVPGVVIAGSLTGTMTAWSSSPDSEPSRTDSPVGNAVRRSSRGGPGANFPSSATASAGTQLDAWGTSTDTPKPDIGCSDGTMGPASATSGNTAASGKTPTGRSLQGPSSTTSTATDSITDSTISKSSLGPSTPADIRLSRPESSAPDETRARGTFDGLSDDSANWRRNSPLAASRAGEPSADRRYEGAFAALPGERRDVDGFGYSRFFLIPKADRADREPVLGGLSQSVSPRIESAHSTVCAKCGRQRVNVPGAACKCPDPEWVRKPQTARANVHPTVKPVDLMRHLVRLVTPTGGTVLDPFLGSGTTAIAAEMEGFEWIGIEKEAEYVRICEARLNGTQRGLGLPA